MINTSVNPTETTSTGSTYARIVCALLVETNPGAHGANTSTYPTLNHKIRCSDSTPCFTHANSRRSHRSATHDEPASLILHPRP